MKKKILNFVMALCCCLPGSFLLTACDGGHTHVFSETVSNQFLKTEATCTESAVYYKSCSCGERSTETFVFGKPYGHEYNYNSLGDGTHEKYCLHDPSDSSIEDCSGREASCSEQAYCELCKNYYGEPGQHDFVLKVTTSEYLKTEATCSNAAEYYYSCECGAVGETWFVYGEPVEHSFVNYVKNNDATCEQDGTKTAICSFENCNEEDTVIDVGSKKGHKYGAWKKDEDGWHKKVCANDNSHIVREQCYGGEATCTNKSVCIECKNEYGNKLQHNYKNNVCDDCKTRKPSEGLLLTLSSDGKYYIVSGMGTCEDTCVVVPDEHNNIPVTHVAAQAFKNQEIEEIWFPYSVTTIGNSAFDGCGNLATVTFGKNVSFVGERAFQNCSNLSRVNYEGTIDGWVGIDFDYISNPLHYGAGLYIDNTLVTEVNITIATRVKPYVFDNYSSLTKVTIGNSVTTIRKRAFQVCKNLENVVIGDNVVTIDEYAFTGCEKLTNVTVGKKVNYIASFAFSNCGNIDNVYYTGSVDDWVSIQFSNANSNPISGAKWYVGNNLVKCAEISEATKVNPYAFIGCTSIETVVMGRSVESIGVQAFYKCNNLQTVGLGGGLTTIKKEAFSYCTKLASIVIPNTVKTIEEKAFAHNSNMETATIGDNVESIGDSAFICSGLIVVSLPHNLTNLGNAVFSGCEKLENATVGNGLANIPSETFQGCINLTNITFGNKINTIDYNAFNNCTKLVSVTLPDNMFYIGTTAFGNCTSLTNVTIGQTDELSITSDAFKDCNAIQNIYYTGDINSYVQIDGMGALLDDDYTKPSKKIFVGNQLVTQVNITTATFISSSVFRGYAHLTSVTIGDSVEIVGTSAFENCSGLTSVTIGSGVTTISERAFYHCLTLSTLTLGNKVETIGESAFYSCEGLTSVTIPNSVKAINNYAFNNCRNLSSLTLGNSVESIGDYAFDTTKITILVIPDSVKTIGGFAFHTCINLTSVTIGSGVTSIGGDAFAWCSNITTLNLGNNLETIGQGSFYECVGLTNLIIPNSVKQIGSKAFERCENLITVTIGSGVTSIGSNAFKDCVRLVEVINLSGLNFTKGSTSNGCVAEHALNIVIGSTSAIENVSGFLFCPSNEGNYLVAYVGEGLELTLPANYKGQSYKISDYAFAKYRNIVSVIISDGVTSIGELSFDRCDSLVSVTVGRNVTSIGSSAFLTCYVREVINLSDLNIGQSLNDHGHIALEAFKVKTEGTSDIVKENDFLFYTHDGVHYLIGYIGTDADPILPLNYKGESYEVKWNKQQN